MAIDLTVAQLAQALRLGDSTEETAEATRLLGFATAAIARHLGDAYEAGDPAILNEAATRVAGFAYDAPFAAQGMAYSDALRQSGAAALLLPLRVMRAGSTGEAVVSAQAADTTDEPGIDKTARDAAQAAQAAADANAAAIAGLDIPTLPMPVTPAEARNGVSSALRLWSSQLVRMAVRAVLPRDEVVDVANGRLPGPPVVMRIGWSQSRSFNALDFNRPLPPIGGSVSGRSSGVPAPPFPPALDTDPTLYMGLWFEGDPTVVEVHAGDTDVSRHFPTADKRALVVDGTAGHYYPSNMRFEAQEGTEYVVVVEGARILTERDRAGLGGLSVTDLGTYTTTAQAASGDVQDTGIASPATGRFLIITLGGEEDVLWFNRKFVHEHSGVPVPGGSTNNSVYIASARPMRMGKTVGGNFALTNGFANLITAGTVITFAVMG